MNKTNVWENKKLVRHSKEYYEWLVNVMNKRHLEEIGVIFSKHCIGTFTKERLLNYLAKEHE
jgi:hypothetical protein